jgi:hypothetical protein
MTVEREGRLTRFVCNGGVDRRGVMCRCNYETDAGSFADAWREAKHMGWVNAESGGTWTHYCGDCKKDMGD